ncbi:MAG: PilZ domain-containing protein [Cellvibrionaceae bacterium]
MSEEDPRRKSKRYKVSWATRLLFADKTIVAARTRDVSSGGVGFEYDQQIPIGEEVNIEFSPMIQGKQYIIRAKGVVTYNMILSGSSGFSHGLKFTLIPRDQFDQLAEVLKSFDQS